MMSRVAYRKIRSLADLRDQRQRIDRELDVKGGRLGDDWREMSRMFSVGYALEQISARAGQFCQMIRMGMTGYRYVRSVVEKYKDDRTDRDD